MNRRILIVDDEETVLFVLRQALCTLGERYEIVSAQDGTEALDEISRRPCALLITDIRLPRLDGVALTRALRQGGSCMPVIWITGFRDGQTLEEAARLGVYRCLAKPVEIDDLRRVSLEALGAGAA